MQAGRCWDEVWGVAVGEQGSRAQGKRLAPPTAVQGGGRSLRVRLKHGRLLGLLVLAGHFPVAGLDALFLHGEGPVDLLGKGGGGGGSFSGCVAMQQHQPELQLDSRCAV